MHNSKNKETTPISAEDCLRHKMSKANVPQTDNKYNELVDSFIQLCNHKHSNVVDAERKQTMASIHTMQPPRHTTLEQSETIRQKYNRIKDMGEVNKQAHNKTFKMKR